MKENWDGPIVLKGIQDLEDAKRAIEIGVQGIVVSNHGGMFAFLPSFAGLKKQVRSSAD